MRSPSKMDTIQIEVTNACVLECSNCTRFVGHKTPFFMSFDQFKEAIDSFAEFQGIVGIMGGEPTLHNEFPRFCEYALSVRPRERLGLWSVFPDKEKYRNYREIICKTFGNILLNDHTRPDIMHGPILVGIEEVVKDEADMYAFIDDCWVQNTWSASVNQKGAFFCEVAAAMSVLFDGPRGWDVTPDWWKRTPKDFKDQIEQYCRKCGCAMPLQRRSSQDERDDISPLNLERLQGVSKKVRDGKYVLSEFKMDQSLLQNKMYPAQTYKDAQYRQGIAARYGIFLVMNERGYWEPRLMDEFRPPKETLFQILQAEYKKPASV